MRTFAIVWITENRIQHMISHRKVCFLLVVSIVKNRVTADLSLRISTASEVLAFLVDREEFKDELCKLASMAGRDGESKDEDDPVGDSSRPDGSQILLDAEVLTPDSGVLTSLALNSPSPAERDMVAQ